MSTAEIIVGTDGSASADAAVRWAAAESDRASDGHDALQHPVGEHAHAGVSRHGQGGTGWPQR